MPYSDPPPGPGPRSAFALLPSDVPLAQRRWTGANDRESVVPNPVQYRNCSAFFTMPVPRCRALAAVVEDLHVRLAGQCAAQSRVKAFVAGIDDEQFADHVSILCTLLATTSPDTSPSIGTRSPLRCWYVEFDPSGGLQGLAGRYSGGLAAAAAPRRYVGGDRRRRQWCGAGWRVQCHVHAASLQCRNGSTRRRGYLDGHPACPCRSNNAPDARRCSRWNVA